MKSKFADPNSKTCEHTFQAIEIEDGCGADGRGQEERGDDDFGVHFE